jgi:hypothetical protein
VLLTNDPVEIFDFIYGDLNKKLQDGAPIRAIGIDSMRAIVYPADQKDESTKQNMGGSAAKYLEPVLKQCIKVTYQHRIPFFLVQQVYQEIDIYKARTEPWVIPGGIALRHASDYILIVEKLTQKKNRIEEGKNLIGGDQQMGHKVRVFFRKNKTANPYRTAEFTLHYEHGIVDTPNELYNLAKAAGIIYHPISDNTGRPNNSMWTIDGYEPIRGEENFRQWFFSNKDIQDRALKLCDGISEQTVRNMNNSKGIKEVCNTLDEIKDINTDIAIDLDKL